LRNATEKTKLRTAGDPERRDISGEARDLTPEGNPARFSRG